MMKKKKKKRTPQFIKFAMPLPLGGKKTRKLYKYKNKYTLKHLRKTFVTHYARGKDKDGRERGLVQASLRMRHSSPKVTKDHYFTEDEEQLRTAHMYETNVVDLKKKDKK